MEHSIAQAYHTTEKKVPRCREKSMQKGLQNCRVRSSHRVRAEVAQRGRRPQAEDPQQTSVKSKLGKRVTEDVGGGGAGRDGTASQDH